MSLTLFLIISLFFIRVVLSIGDVFKGDNMNPIVVELTDYIFPLITLSLFICVAGIAVSDFINRVSKIIVIIDLLYINISNVLANLSEVKIQTDSNFKYFVKVDNFLSILQFVITFILVFVSNTSVFVFLILFIFILHFLAVPIRHGKTDYF